MQKSIGRIVVGLSIIAPTTAYAQADASGGIYVSGSIGLTLSDDQLIDGANAAGAPRRIITDMDKGTALTAAVGYASPEKNWGRVRAEAS